jgi:hypothetical protein
MEEERYEEATLAGIKRVLKLAESLDKVVWVEPTSNSVKVGDAYGYLDARGYTVGRVLGLRLYLHQLIFFFVHGYIPNEIDHIDRDKTNNHIDNLRDTTRGDNGRNREAYNKLGIKGVYLNHRGKYEGRITYDGVGYYLGSYKTIEEAKDVVSNKYIELGIS